MDILEVGLWYKFCVPIPASSGESEEAFLVKARDCLSAFFERHTQIPKEYWGHRHPFKPKDFTPTLESLKGECGALSFMEFELAGMPQCDVDYYVGTPQDNYGRIGIDILTSAKRPERKPVIDFLQEKWKNFDYHF